MADDKLTAMDDPAFLAERRRVRTLIERTPDDELSPELTARYAALNDEFDRRARAAWANAG